MVDFLKRMNQLTEISFRSLLGWCELCPRKFSRWRERYGKANEHNAQVPRDHWLEEWEKQAIIDYARQHPLDGYRSLTFMMLDADVAAVSPTTTYRVLKAAGLIGRAGGKLSKKGTGFVQPLAPHEHWHAGLQLPEHWRRFLLPLRRARRLYAHDCFLGHPHHHARD